MNIVALGAGRMGRGIGHVFAYAGYTVDIVDFKPRAPAQAAALRVAALGEIAANLSFLRDAGVLDAAQADSILGRVRVLSCEEADAALAEADIVFEGVTETEAAKREALARLCRLASPRAIIASTTSAILADTLAGFVSHPGRFLNAHFLNPAFLIPLVELSPAKATHEQTYARIRELLESAGKVVVRCAPSPGYIVPRLQAAMMNEAARLVEEGVATPADIDRAVRAGFGPRYTAMGICEFIDYGGLDILYHASSSMAKSLSAPRYEPPAIVRRLMEEGKRGVRDGEGLYDWRGRDMDAYQRELLGRYVALFAHLRLLPLPEPADRLAHEDQPGRKS